MAKAPRKPKSDVTSDKPEMIPSTEPNPAPLPQAMTQEAPSQPDATGGTETTAIDKRMSFSVDAAGQLDATSLREATREKLKVVLRDPKLHAKLGLIDPASIVEISEDQLSGLYVALGGLEAWIAERSLHCSAELARVFHYSPAEIRELMPLTKRLAAKYAKFLTFSYMDECQLAFMLTMSTVAKLQAVKAAMAGQPGSANSTRPNGAFSGDQSPTQERQ